MTKPQPKSIDPDEVLQLARQVVKADPFPYLATIDGDQPRLRPVSPVKTEGFTVYVASLRMYHKTQEIAANPNVELCYLDGQHNQVRLTGVAEVVADRELLQQIWDTSPLLRQFLDSLEKMRCRIGPKRGISRRTPTRLRETLTSRMALLKRWLIDSPNFSTPAMLIWSTAKRNQSNRTRNT